MTTQRLSVEGMKCNGCKSTVEDALRGVDGVHEVTVSLDDDLAKVDADERLDADALVAAVQDAGFEAQTA